MTGSKHAITPPGLDGEQELRGQPRAGIGAWYALWAYGLWGVLPIYWKWLKVVPSPQLFCHRIIWSFLALLAIILISGQGKALLTAIRDMRVLRVYTIAAVLIGINWLTYIWAVNAGFVVETSLGYFINPLLSVLLGVIFFRERLRPWQWVTIVMASTGVIYLTVSYGSLPWIALTLAVSFGLYTLIKKMAPLGSLFGLTLETGVLLLPVMVFLLHAERTGQGAFLHAGVLSDILLVGAGLVTAVPLLLFSSAARRIPLSYMGILQYIAPTIQFLLGVFLYREPFAPSQAIGFGIVWTALIIYGVEGYIFHRTQAFPVLSE